MNCINKIALICLTLILCQNSYAQSGGGGGAGGGSIYIEETFFPVYVKKNDAQSLSGGSGSKSVPTESGFGYDFRTTLGYVFWDSMLLGLTYNYYHVGTSRPSTADYEGLDTTLDKKEFGPTIGAFWGSFRFALTYFVYGTKSSWTKYTLNDGTISTDEIYRNTGGSGFQFAIGYGLNLGSSWTIGPTLIYREISYSHQVYTVNVGAGTAYDSSSLKTKPIDAEIKPMITVIFRM